MTRLATGGGQNRPRPQPDRSASSAANGAVASFRCRTARGCAHHRSGARNPVQLAGAGDSGRALPGLFRRQRRVRAGSAVALRRQRHAAGIRTTGGAAAGKNLALLQGKGVVINTNALSWLAGEGQPFDVVFLDPPFRKSLLAETALLLEQRGWLADEAWIYVSRGGKRRGGRACQLAAAPRESRRPGGLSPLYSFARENRPC